MKELVTLLPFRENFSAGETNRASTCYRFDVIYSKIPCIAADLTRSKTYSEVNLHSLHFNVRTCLNLPLAGLN